jgi:phosphate transport system protein
MPPTEHTFKQFDSDLESVRSKVLQMGGLVESQIRNAVRGLSSGDLDSIDTAIEVDRQVNEFEIEIDDACAQIIARRQPTAGDLRTVLSIAKTVTDLERMGDEAKKIARMAKKIHDGDRAPVPRFADIRYAAQMATGMLRNSLDAFARLDVALAARVIREDAAIDSEFRAMLRELVTYMMEDPRTISTVIDIIWIAKAIERIGDHSKNISEYVIYIVKGKDVRHVDMDQLDRDVAS